MKRLFLLFKTFSSVWAFSNFTGFSPWKNRQIEVSSDLVLSQHEMSGFWRDFVGFPRFCFVGTLVKSWWFIEVLSVDEPKPVLWNSMEGLLCSEFCREKSSNWSVLQNAQNVNKLWRAFLTGNILLERMAIYFCEL